MHIFNNRFNFLVKLLLQVFEGRALITSFIKAMLGIILGVIFIESYILLLLSLLFILFLL